MTMSQGEEATKGLTAAGSVAGMITNTNLGAEDNTEVMIIMATPPILQTLIKNL